MHEGVASRNTLKLRTSTRFPQTFWKFLASHLRHMRKEVDVETKVVSVLLWKARKCLEALQTTII